MDQTNYTLPGIMQYLQNQYTIIEKNKILNELEKSELKLKITKLESERNSLLLENSTLKDKIKQLESKSPSSNGNGLGTSKQLDTIDMTNLVRARQFLKNTTNEILYLLNSPSVDNDDPLELSKDEPEFSGTHDPFIVAPPVEKTASLSPLPRVTPPPPLIQSKTTTTTTKSPSTRDKELSQLIDEIELNDKETYPFDKGVQFEADTDSETIINDDDEDADVEEVMTGSSTTTDANVLVSKLDGAKTPIKYTKVDSLNEVLFIHSGNDKLITIDLRKENDRVSTLVLNPNPKITSRVFCIDETHSMVIEGASTSDNGYLSIASPLGSEKLFSFDSAIKSLDTVPVTTSSDAEESTVTNLAVLLENGKVQFFQIGSNNTVAPYLEAQLNAIQPYKKIVAAKFISDTEISLIADDRSLSRYDYIEDSFVYIAKLTVNLSPQSRYTLSRRYFVEILDSTTAKVFDLYSEEVHVFPITSSFKVTNLVCEEQYFALGYSNGSIEVYDLTYWQARQLDLDDDDVIGDVIGTTFSLGNKRNSGDEERPRLIKQVEYYAEGGKPMIIKDLSLALGVDENKDAVKVYVVGSDLQVKEYYV